MSDLAVELEPGDTLLLYTDGLTEAGAPARTLSTDDVAELLRERPRGHRRGDRQALPRARVGTGWRGHT